MIFRAKKRGKDDLKHNIILLGLVSFFNDISSKMIEPILPMFLTVVGANPQIIGIIGGLRDSISSLLKILAGYWSDRIGKRKPFVFLGYFSSSVFKFLIGISRTTPLVFLFSSLERIGKGLRAAPRDAILAESMPEHHGRGFGIHRFFDSLGAVLGAVIVFLLLWYLKWDYKVIIIVAALLGFLSLVPLSFVKEPKVKPKKISFLTSLNSLPKSLKFFMLVASIFAFSNISYMFFILKVQDIFVDSFLKKTIPILFYILFNSFYASLAIVFGKLADRKSKPFVIIIGYLLFSLTTLGFAVSSKIMSFVILFILYGISNAMINSNQRALVADLSRELEGTGLGTYHFIIGIIAFFSSSIAGLLYSLHPSYAFYYSSILSLSAALTFVVLRKKIISYSSN